MIENTKEIPIPIDIRKKADYGEVLIQQGGNTENLGYIDDEDISLSWFIHVTDIHLNSHEDYHTNIAYRDFLNFSYNRIHPLTLFLTGDLIGGSRTESYLNLDGRVTDEFKMYYSIVNSSSYASDPNPYRYIDLAGNHDRNVDWNLALFKNYTLTGNKFNSPQVFFSANFSHGDVIFSGLDGPPFLSPPIFFGSEGTLEPEDLQEYLDFLNLHNNAETKFTFHHQHPLESFGLIFDNYTNFIRDVNSINAKYNVDGIFYGHTHMDFMETYGDQVFMMGDRFRDAYFDEYYNETVMYNYKLVSIDSGGVNVASEHFSHTPNIIITNPSNGVFLDSADTIKNTRGDGHVRVLVFRNNSDSIKSVSYRIDEESWQPMYKYKGTSELLFESSRGTAQDPNYAIPNDNHNHQVKVKLEMESGRIVYQSSNVVYNPIRKPFFQTVFIILAIFVIGIIIIINRDNLPLMRQDGKRRRLTHKEKVEKRNKINLERNKPWWLPYVAFCLVLSILFLPWGIFPANQGAPVLAYSFFVISGSYGVVFFSETLIYSSIRIFLTLPNYYWGIRTYHPELVNNGSWFLIASSLLMIYYPGIESFGINGLLLPGAYFDLAIALVILIGNLKNTFFYRSMQKIFGNQQEIE